MQNKTKQKKQQYQAYATNIRIKDYAVVLCKMKYATENADPEVLANIIGDALEMYFKHKQAEIRAKKENKKMKMPLDI